MPQIKLEQPDLQIAFAIAMKEIRETHLQDALAAAAASMEIQDMDRELHQYADHDCLKRLAAHGMRGELLFALPCVLAWSPRLLGYYRLLLGYSQKEFYSSSTGVGRFKSMEERGVISPGQRGLLPELCKELNRQAEYLLYGFEEDWINCAFFDQLTLLTLGPQLRGGANVRRGSSAIEHVFQIVYGIVRGAVIESNHRRIVLKNKAGRTVHIQFAADPDIVIREELGPGFFRNLVAIEVKGGQDYSNIHNRIGEAEKSHQKAKRDGFIECWTVLNVGRVDLEKARKESPATNRFYQIASLQDKQSPEYKDFSMQILSIVSI